MTKEKRIIFALVLTVATLTVALALSVIFPREIDAEKSYYDIKCESYGVVNANLSKGQIVFLGDSITDLYPLDDYYSSLPLALYNRGIGGDTTEGLLKRLDVSCIDISPSTVVLMIGTNDINGGRNIEDIVKTYEEILEKIKKKLPKTRIISVSVIPMNKTVEEYSTVDAVKNTEKVKALNREIEGLVKKYEGEYLNIFDSLTGEDGLLDAKYTEDGLHLDSDGFAIWSEHLLPLLSQ